MPVQFMPSLILLYSPGGGLREEFARVCTQCMCMEDSFVNFVCVASESEIKRHERPAGTDNFIVLILHLFL